VTDSRWALFWRSGHIRGLDELRAIAVLAVVFHHSTGTPRQDIFGHGPLGVDLFFALSGFLITTLLLRENAQRRIDIGAFYTRRARRILPLYYVVLLGYVVHNAWFQATAATRTHFWESLPYYLSFTTNLGVRFAVPHPVSFAFSWSLAIEEQFYLVWPWLLRAVLEIGSARTAAPKTAGELNLPAAKSGIRVLGCALLLIAIDQWCEPSKHCFARTLGDVLSTPILLGTAMAGICAEAKLFRPTDAILKHPFTPWLLAIAILCMLHTKVELLAIQGALAWLVLASALSSTRSPHGNSKQANFLQKTRGAAGAVLRAIGRVSYGMYMTHITCVVAARTILRHLGIPTSDGYVFLLTLPLAYGLAVLCSKVIEQRFRQKSAATE
jgi:peptidoglycan/LPS O-acetylase OafA/YrhL